MAADEPPFCSFLAGRWLALVGYVILQPMGEVVRQYLVSGRVQGVGYRHWVVGRARLLGLTGWVRNLHDGRVEIVARGVDATLEALGRQLWEGPTLAHVIGVEIGIAPASDARSLPSEGFIQAATR